MPKYQNGYSEGDELRKLMKHQLQQVFSLTALNGFGGKVPKKINDSLIVLVA